MGDDRKQYLTYKPSGIEWLGEVPEGWKILRLKNIVATRITDGPHATPEFLSEGIPFLSVDGIQDGELVFEGCRYISEEDHAQYKKKALPQFGDILLGKAASTGKVARVKVAFEFSIWSPLALIKINANRAVAYFLEFVLKSPEIQAQVDILCTANTQKNISMEDIPLLAFALPPINEQHAIADFLDRETERIDGLIEKKARQIELLQEKRTALISHAVTKGLDPNAKMKDSGIEWLGEVPEGWEINALRRLLRPFDGIKIGPFGSQLKSEFIKENGIKVYGQENIINRNFTIGSRFIDEQKFDELAVCEVKQSDLVLTMMGTVGQCQIVPEGIEKGIMDSHLLRLRIKDEHILSEFLVWLIDESQYIKDQIQIEGKGSIMHGLNSYIIKSLIIALPPVDEQHAIADFLDRETERIDGLIDKVRNSIDLLREYRTALISAAVTGKIDVRKEVA